jgi:putative membrane protein
MMFGNWDMMDGWSAGGFWMPVAMVLIALIVVVGVWLIVRSNRVTPATGPTAVDILGQRFARGEITKDEYEAARRTLGV